MRPSLLITTYNWPRALDAVLASVARQQCSPFEVVVADDGSGDDTAAVIERYRTRLGVPLHHAWQPDAGFRAARARNLALARATGDYIVLIDGDMVLPRGFLADHVRVARPGCFVQGSRILLDRAATARFLDRGGRLSILSRGIGNRLNALRWPGLLRRASRVNNDTRGTRSCNMGFWRDDAVRANGFNEDFEGWGREDSEFAQRLLNAGLKRLRLRLGGSAYHLFHDERPRTAVPRNDELLRRTQSQRLTRCENGLDRHMAVGGTG